MGAMAYDLIKLCQFKPGDLAVEIGSERGEGSTSYLRQYCNERDIPFYSVDIHPEVPDVIQADGAEWLQDFVLPIRFAYLDNFDYIFPEIEGKQFVKDQIKLYAELGYTMNNDQSAATHLKQAMLISEVAVKGAVIIIDDTYFTGMGLAGKGAIAVPWLLDSGWMLINDISSNWEEGYAAMRKL